MPTAVGSDGCRIHWIADGAGDPILLVHGFASTLERNWVSTRWVATLTAAGWRTIAFDQRGHGASEKRYRPEDYRPELLVADATAVLDAAGVDEPAVLMGYSMGARVALEAGLTRAERVRALELGGIGAAFRDFDLAPDTRDRVAAWRRDDREIVARALEADDPSVFPPAARAQRRFAEQNHQDLRALAACWRKPIRSVGVDELARLRAPTLIVVGERDGVAGDARPLAAAIPGAALVVLRGKDHMTAVGAREHREAVLRFLEKL